MLRRLRSLLFALAWLAIAVASARATPVEFISPRDPIVAELRVLELYDLPPDSGRFRLPHFHTWPVRRLELMGDGAPIGAGELVRRVVADRLERELQRDAVGAFVHERAQRSTRRMFQRVWADGDRVEISAGLEGAGVAERVGGATDSRWQDGSGLHLRGAAQVDRWLAYSHLTAGHLEGADNFTDVLVSGSDVALLTDESYLAYAVDRKWSIALGRQRFAWGPGEEGSLLVSRTAASLTALHLHAHVQPLRADFTSINATVETGAEEQFAAHRLEWQPTGGLRIGIAEAVRYQSSGWQAVYVASVIPYSLAQRLEQQDGDSLGSRNNVLFAADFSWRPADGTRLYGELLIDDASATTSDVPNKYGWQLGLDGAWTRGFTRLTWNTEYTWLSRFVYTSFYDRTYVAQGVPIGYPTGPDSRRLHVRVSWDPRMEWQVQGLASRTWRGESGIDVPFVPGDPVPPVDELAGVAEVTDSFTGVLRWWPASGVDLSLSAGWRRTVGANHVDGAVENGYHAGLAFRLTR